jgi:hypothetical protein
MAEPSVAALVLASLVVTHAESVRRLSARPARPPARPPHAADMRETLDVRSGICAEPSRCRALLKLASAFARLQCALMALWCCHEAIQQHLLRLPRRGRRPYRGRRHRAVSCAPSQSH